MGTSAFFGLVAGGYYLSFLLLTSLLLFIAWRGGKRTQAGLRLRRTFFWLALSLLVWQGTLFLEARTEEPAWQLGLGRVNFAAVVLTASLALQFVQDVAGKRLRVRRGASYGLWGETWTLVALTLFTPWVDTVERVEDGHALSTYGPLFGFYLLHVIGCLVGSLLLAFMLSRRAAHRVTRRRLRVIAAGILATGGIASITNVLLPYGFEDFRYCDVGTLSTVFFLAAVTYATFVYRLFNVRLLLRKTLVYGLLLAFVVGAYNSAVFLLTAYLANHVGDFTWFPVLLIAFSVDPLRRFLEKLTDRLLFDPRSDEMTPPKSSLGSWGARQD